MKGFSDKMQSHQAYLANSFIVSLLFSVMLVIMETKDWASVLGIASGIPVSILIACVVIALMARFRRRHHRQSTQNEHIPGKVHETKADLKITTNTEQRQTNAEDPDIIINSNSGKDGTMARVTQEGRKLFTV